MFRWLPVRLQTLYRRIAEAAPYVRARPPPAIPDPPPTPGAWQRLHRLHIAQDAFCARRPGPRRLFKAEPALRNADSWCDPWTWRGLFRNAPPRCDHCAQARRLFDTARAGSPDERWRAECRLHRLARRGAVRLLAERREWRDGRRGVAAQKRAERARRGAQQTPPDLASGGPGPPRAEVWHRAARWEEERSLLRAHARLLTALLRRRRARMTDAARRPAPPFAAPVAPPAPTRADTAAPAEPAEPIAPAAPVAPAAPAAPVAVPAEAPGCRPSAPRAAPAGRLRCPNPRQIGGRKIRRGQSAQSSGSLRARDGP